MSRTIALLQLAACWFALSVLACVFVLGAVPWAIYGWAAERIHRDKRMRA